MPLLLNDMPLERANRIFLHPMHQEGVNTLVQLIKALRQCQSSEDYFDFQQDLLAKVLAVQQHRAGCRGSHGAGAYAFPGGKPHPGEAPADALAREVREETGFTCTAIRPITWTSEVFPETGLHFVTLHHLAEVAAGEPQLLEPGKCDGWDWHPWDDLPQPLFAAAANLIATGWRPSA